MTTDILFVLCLNDRGGAEMSMLKLAQGLLARGRRVTLAVYGAQPALASERGFTGPVVDLQTVRTVGIVLPLIKLLFRQKPAVVISALTHTNIASLIAATLAGAETRVIATEHGLDGIAACQKSPFFRSLTRLTYGRAAAVVTVSETLSRQWRALLPPRTAIVTIYNPVIDDIAKPAPPPAHEWLALKTIPVIIGAGRLKEEKNFALLLHAFARLRKTRAAKLIILGEGDQRPLLRQIISGLGLGDDILLPGFVADPSAWLAHAALFVSPSNREGFGNAIVEALAHGVPVVATDCPYGPAEILDNGRYGRLVPMQDEEALARAIDIALDSPVYAQALRERAGQFTSARCVDAYLKLVDNSPPS